MIGVGDSQLLLMHIELPVLLTMLSSRLSLTSSSRPLPSGIVKTPSTSRKSTFMIRANVVIGAEGHE